MAGDSNIEWTDATWNPVVGCKMVSPGCANCYAETMSNRLAGMALADDVKLGAKPTRKDHYLKVIDFERGRFNGKVELVPEALADPLGWRKPRRVFVNSMSDLFHEGVPFDFIDKVFAVMALTPRHTYQILTKRPERMAEYLNGVRLRKTEDSVYNASLDESDAVGGMPAWRWPLRNVWLGTSIEDRKRLGERAPLLADCQAVVTFWSVEPLLEDLGQLPLAYGPKWVIVGGESGRGARPCNAAWVRSVVEQCRAARVACFVKQLGADARYPSGEFSQPSPQFGAPVEYQYSLKLKDKKGGDMDEWPEDLRVRQMPGALAPAEAES